LVLNIVNKIINWIDKRIPVKSLIEKQLSEPIPVGVGWRQIFGSIALFLFGLQIITGIFLALNYSATPEHAYGSIQYIENQMAFGKLVRGVHHWGSSLMVIFVVIHMLRAFFYSAYKYPREMMWVSGSILLLLVLGFGLTGYLLPWDQKAYWATVVSINIAGTTPIIGNFLVKVIQGGTHIGAVTLSYFYTIHTILLPLVTLGLITFHVVLIRIQGITPPFKMPDEKVIYKGSFYPNQLYKDAIAMLGVLILAMGLAYYFGAPLGNIADLTDSTFTPRPEWYFLFLFQLLKLFEGPLEIVGTLLIPGIATAALILLPFYDRNPARKPGQRKLALLLMYGTMIGITALTLTSIIQDMRNPALAKTDGKAVRTKLTPVNSIAQMPPGELAGFQIYQDKQCSQCHGDVGDGVDKLSGSGYDNTWLKDHFKDPGAVVGDSTVQKLKVKKAERKALIAFINRFNSPSGYLYEDAPVNIVKAAFIVHREPCLNCHLINGDGGVFGPELTHEGSEGRSREWLIGHFKDPKAYSPDTKMPAFDKLPNEELEALTDYMLLLK